MNSVPHTSSAPARVFKLLSAPDWRAAVAAGAFTGSAVDVADGYIHFSTAEQVAETAARHFAAVPDLVLLTIATSALPGEMRMEPSRGGALFPHLYGGSIPVAAVLAAEAVPVSPFGGHDFSAFGLPWAGEL